MQAVMAIQTHKTMQMYPRENNHDPVTRPDKDNYWHAIYHKLFSCNLLSAVALGLPSLSHESLHYIQGTTLITQPVIILSR